MVKDGEDRHRFQTRQNRLRWKMANLETNYFFTWPDGFIRDQTSQLSTHM